MKKLAFLPLTALAFTAACDDTKSPVAPEGANFELVDKDSRVLTADINAHVYGTFSLNFGGGATTVVGRTGDGIIPGNQKVSGRCEAGLWFNPQGKPTAGTYNKPHPHCVQTVSGQTIQVVLEPISVDWGNAGQSDNEFLRFTKEGALDANGNEIKVKYVGAGNCPPRKAEAGECRIDPNGDKTSGEGIIRAFAIDAVTKARVGTLTFNLADFTTTSGNLFATECTVGAVTISSTNTTDLLRCLPHVFSATYEPLAQGGVGTTTNNVQGFLYWVSARTPFNYSDMQTN